MAKGGRRIENPEDIGEVSEADFARLPDVALMFAARADRLTAVAEGNVLGDYLRFLAGIVLVQHEAANAVPVGDLFDPAVLQTAFGSAMPPLSADLLSRTDDFATMLAWVLERADIADAPPPARAARAWLVDATLEERIALAKAIFEGAYPTERLAESLFVAAALQVFLATLASRLPVARLRPVADGVCPACGSAPAVSMIVSWPGANRVRYCCCSLCGTMWNYVRIKCTSCSATGGISYLTVEGGSQDIAVETCDTCRCYIKHLQKHRRPELEPFADDIASFGLDLMVRQEGYRPGGVNPLFISQ